MKKVTLLSVVFVIQLFTQSLYAQSFGGSNVGFRGIAGYMGFGVAEFTVLNPTSEFRMDQGIMAYMAIEKELGKSGLFITFSLNYMSSAGQSFYDYTLL